MKKSKLYIALFSVLIPVVLASMPAHSAGSDKSQPYQIHTVKEGDTLSKISWEYYGDYTKFSLIAKLNKIKDINRLKVGQQIKIPMPSVGHSKNPPSVVEGDLSAAAHDESKAFEETSLNKATINSQLDLPAVIFIIIYLLTMLSLVLIKWLGMKGAPHIQESNDDLGLGLKRRKWRMKSRAASAPPPAGGI